MTQKTSQLADRFRGLNEEVIATVNQCSDSDWKRSSAGEDWPVAVVAHHIAVVNSGFAGMVELFANGETYTPEVNMEEIHAENARHAREYANVGKQEVIGKLEDGGKAVEAAIRKLDDAQLDNPAGVYGGNPLTVNQVIEYVVFGHTNEHFNSIQQTLGS